MSRSNSTENPNPAKRFYQWAGSGGFKYFDKSIGENGENVHIGLPFQFMVLDTLSTIKGFNDGANSGYWSNEIRDIKREILTVRNKAGICAKGLYEEVITSRNTTGAKYCQSVYIGLKEGDNTMVIANIQMMGAALGAWIDFRKKNKIYDGGILVSGMTEGKKGATVYQIPIFEKVEVSTDDDQIAKMLDEELQAYLRVYLDRSKEEIAEAHVAEKVEATPTEARDGLPF